MDTATEKSVALLNGALRQQPGFVGKLVDQIPGIFWSTDTDLRFTACVGAGLAALDLRPSQVVGANLRDFLTPENPRHVAALEGHRRALLGESCTYDLEYQGRFYRGHVEPLHGQDGTTVGCLGMALDVTESKQTERRLQAKYAITKIMAEAATSEEAIPQILRTICETFGWSWGAFWTTDLQGQRLSCLESWHDSTINGSEFLKASRELPITRDNSLPGRVWTLGQPLWLPDVAKESWSVRAPFALKADLHSAIALPVLRNTEVVGVMEFSSREIREPDNAVVEMLASVARQIEELMERKRSEKALTESEQRFRRLVEYSPDAMFINRQNKIVFLNNPCLKLFGASAPQQVIGRPVLDFIHPDYHAVVKERVRRLVELGEPVPLIEEKIVRLDGTTVDVEISASPFLDEGVTAIQVVCRDVSDRKKLEQQYHQAQKMEAIGQLAGGVAHDFNNLLTIISGYSELLVSRFPANDPTRGLIQEIHKAGERAALLTRQLLSFSRKAVIEPRVLDLNAIVTDTEKMLRRLIGEDIGLTTVLDPALGQVKADAGQIEQIIVNLAVNARDAMPKGGKLTIETHNVELDESYAAMHPEVKPGPYVMLAVSDTGCGMSEETKARIFEPFFTTKGVGKGTGLGLATVFGIVKQSGGHVGVYSEPGRGATFKVYLPPVEERVPSGKSLHGLKVAPHGSETILLVEDEDAVRGITRLALQMHGYTVLEAKNGAEALKFCEQRQGPIHLLITDVVMPDMGGREVAESMTAFKPGIKILYLSGYTDDAVVRHGILQAEVAFLQKPFSPIALANKVREVLDQ
jgi:PAS domain S-box-containing protein